jgi:hypothetical protein
MARRNRATAPVTIYDRQATNPDPSIIVFGMNERGSPQASWFTAADAETALKAASLMGLQAATIGSEKHEALAKELQQGQVFASDRLFAPGIKPELYSDLFELCGSAPAEDPVLTRPTNWDEIAVGSLVLVNDGGNTGSFYECVVMATNDHLLQLRWRTSPRDASFIRSKAEVGLAPLQSA